MFIIFYNDMMTCAVSSNRLDAQRGLKMCRQCLCGACAPWRHFLHHGKCYKYIKIHTRWCPPVISWFISPLTIDISPINHSYWSYKPT